jgi:hypothetical protein
MRFLIAEDDEALARFVVGESDFIASLQNYFG